MRINEIRTMSGPNFYSHHPVLLMKLDLEDLAGKESFEIPGLIDRMIDLLPGLHSHYCSKGRCGGFVERLREGTYFGHVVEHVALELTELAGVPVFHGKTRRAEEPGSYNVIIEYEAEQGTKRLLRMAVEMVESLILHRKDRRKGQREGSEPFPLEKRLEEVRKLIARTELG